MPSDFLVLPGLYQAFFIHLEPLLTLACTFVIWFFPGAQWFHSRLIPGPSSGVLDARTTMVTWQLGNCYLLMVLTSSVVFRVVRDTLPENPEAQERIIGAGLTALALADITHCLVSWIGLPEELRFAFGSWNSVVHGNITFLVILCSMRLAWFAGFGRQRYYYGKTALKSKSA